MAHRVILHADMNNCYAAIECLHRPELSGFPVAVAGDPTERHGIILAKNTAAKALGVKTGEAIWQARRKCPELILVPPNFPLYARFSRLFRGILLSYTDMVEPFGIDEAWLDVSGSMGLWGDGQHIADDIRRRVREELGVTVSVGVSFNKVFAKMGSKLQKNDATMVISRENYKSVVWPLPAGQMIFLGRKTLPKLQRRGIDTIGDLAACSPEYLRGLLGKWGETLWSNANGLDDSPVALYDERSDIKSVSNSTTCPRDLVTREEVRLIVYVLSESVAERLRQYRLKGRVVAVSVRDKELCRFTRQCTLTRPTDLSGTIAAAALRLINAHWYWNTGIRSLGVRVSELQSGSIPLQIEVFNPEDERHEEALERTLDSLRARFGRYSVQRAIMLSDTELSGFDPAGETTINSVAFNSEVNRNAEKHRKCK
ncbi:MAG: DNA polymerase IV [Syntrophomonadaceae bacterium]|nr:DNA polymerase IV [Syntrophomonadaceae bacterium]